jgi:methionyl-tRNA formyltransferase
LREIDPDLIVVVAFGKILPKNVLEYPKYGCVNVHGSLLPAYRGAAPMQRAIIDGCGETGVTTMMMDVGLDTGDMLVIEKMPIEEHDNFETVHDKLGALGAKTLLETVAAMKNGTVERIKQDDAGATYAAKIEKADCLIDFSKSAQAVHDLVRGLSPIPLAFTHTPDGKLLKVTATEVVSLEGETQTAGEILSLDGGKITVACGKGKIALLSVLPEGKKRMSAADFINGRKIKTGDVLA